MDQEPAFEKTIRLKQEQLADLKLCLTGNSSSKRWQDISAEVNRLEGIIANLTDKMNNNTPRATRDAQTRNKARFQ